MNGQQSSIQAPLGQRKGPAAIAVDVFHQVFQIGGIIGRSQRNPAVEIANSSTDRAAAVASSYHKAFLVSLLLHAVFGIIGIACNSQPEGVRLAMPLPPRFNGIAIGGAIISPAEQGSRTTRAGVLPFVKRRQAEAVGHFGRWSLPGRHFQEEGLEDGRAERRQAILEEVLQFQAVLFLRVRPALPLFLARHERLATVVTQRDLAAGDQGEANSFPGKERHLPFLVAARVLLDPLELPGGRQERSKRLSDDLSFLGVELVPNR